MFGKCARRRSTGSSRIFCWSRLPVARDSASIQYLQTRVESVTVPAADVGRAYDGSLDQFPGVLPAEAKYRIRRTMEDNARAAALRGLLHTLRQGARVTNRLVSDVMATLEAAAHEGPSSGNPDAPLTIIEFSDFDCPYCRAAQPVLKRMMERWPDWFGTSSSTFRSSSTRTRVQAVRAAVCADRQDRFWAMHDRIFAVSELQRSFSSRRRRRSRTSKRRIR